MGQAQSRRPFPPSISSSKRKRPAWRIGAARHGAVRARRRCRRDRNFIHDQALAQELAAHFYAGSTSLRRRRDASRRLFVAIGNGAHRPRRRGLRNISPCLRHRRTGNRAQGDSAGAGPHGDDGGLADAGGRSRPRASHPDPDEEHAHSCRRAVRPTAPPAPGRAGRGGGWRGSDPKTSASSSNPPQSRKS